LKQEKRKMDGLWEKLHLFREGRHRLSVVATH
jgi:hypothetical protein